METGEIVQQTGTERTKGVRSRTDIPDPIEAGESKKEKAGWEVGVNMGRLEEVGSGGF